MNHIYRLCWNRTLRAWVPASELAKGKGAGTDRGRPAARLPLMLSLLSVSLGMSGLAWAGNTPTGGQIVSGSGQITQSGNVTTIRQNSQTLSLNWQSFDVGANQTVEFVQPGSSSIAVNRILGNTASEIYGHLDANGQVWLINPNGVLFGQGSQVNVGGIVASTLDLDDDTLGTDKVRFAGNGRGSVVNKGSITAAQGGYVALLGNTVSNQGSIRAQLGTVALGGGTAMTLTFADNHLMHLVVDANTVRSLVENRQLIVANGGNVLMTAGARNSLVASAVNNTGTVQAQTVQDRNGTITLLGGMEAGTVNVGGTLDASAPNGGNGGQIETSAAHFALATDAAVTSASAGGKGGTWLVDPVDLTIDSAAANTIATTLNGGTNVIQQTTATGASGIGNQSTGNGDINVNAAISWNSAATLTLDAYHNVNLNAAIANSGSGKTVLEAGNAFVNNAGANALAGHWAIYSVRPTANTLGGLRPGFIQYNAAAGAAAAPGATGNGLFYSAAATINIAGFRAGANGTPAKSYDGTSNLLVNELNYTLSGGGNGDALTAISGGYGQSDAGTGLTVTAPTTGSAYAILNGTTPVYGYTVAGGASANTGAINPATLTISIVGPSASAGANSLSKVYDGTNAATLNSLNYKIDGLVAGQSVTVNQPSQVGYGTVSGNSIIPIVDVNTLGGTIAAGGGGDVPISAIFSSANFAAGAGTKLSNYDLTGLTATGTGAITQAPVYLSGVLALNKTYDTSTSDLLDTSNASIYGIVNGDNVALDASHGVGNFADANAGNGKVVTLGGFVLTGDAVKVTNYNLIVPANLTANIARAQLQVYGATVGNKVYDGKTATTSGELNLGGATFTGTQGSDSLRLDQANVVGNFSQSDVGSGLAVTVGGLAVRNMDGSVNDNYSVGSVQGGTSVAPAALIANIVPATLTIAFNPGTSPDKIYDGTNYATLKGSDFIVTGMVGSEQVSVIQTPATYNGSGAPNVGTYDVTSALQSSDLDFANGAKAGNYSFNTIVTGTGRITQAPLSLLIDGNPSKVYDGNSSASLTAGNFMLSGVIPGETINLVGPFVAGYYSGSPGTPESNAGTWGVAATLTSGNYQFTAGNGNPAGSLGNYILPTTALGFGTITPRGVTGQIAAGINGVTKVYDGTTAIALGQGNIVFGGFLNGDGGTVTAPVSGTFATRNTGTQPISALLNGSNVGFTCAGGGTACLGNYTYDGVAGHTLANADWSITAYGSGVIQQKELYVTLSGVTKQYDGNTAVLPLGNGNFNVYGYANNDASGAKDGGWVSGEGAVITPTASFAYGSPNVARDINGNVLGNIEVKGTLTSNNYAPIGSTLLSNYRLVYDIDQNVGRITPAPLYVNGVYAQDKIYDGGNGALINIGNGQLAGLADVDKNASAITLGIGNATASTADGIGSSTGGTIVANSNGTFTASGSPVGGTFAGANAGNGRAVTTVFSLGGSSAGNYTLHLPALVANITPRPLMVSGLTANSKTYDGTTAATFTFATPTLEQASGTGSSVRGLLSQDSGSVALNQSSGTGTFATSSANADPSGNFLSATGRKIAVVASGFTLDGSAAGNYVLAQPVDLSANIMQAQIALSLDGPIRKVYDGTTSITIPTGNNQSSGNTSAGYHTSGWINGEGATITQTHSASYASAAATVDGSGNPVAGGNGFTNVTANLVSSDWQPGSGTSLSNYALPTSVTGNVGVITPLVLNLSASRVYDATANIYASLSGNVTNNDDASVFGTLYGLNGDHFTVTGQGVASGKNVGTYTGAGFGLGTLALQAVAGDASNYTLVGGIDTYTITRAPLNINVGAVAQKVYDGTTAAVVTGASLTRGNAKGDVLGSDVLTLATDAGGNIAGTFNNKNAGLGKAVSIPTSDIGGADAGNYQLVQPAGLTGDIAKRPVVISGLRQYNGLGTVLGNSGAIAWNPVAAVSGDPNSGVVSGDTVKVNGGTGVLASADVGSYHSDGTGSGLFDAAGLALSNANYAIASTGNTFQVTPMVLALTGTRVYDGTANADADLITKVNGSSTTSCGTDCVTLTGANGETLNLAGTGTGALTSANVAGTSSNPAQVAFATGGGGIAGLALAGNGTAKTSNYTLAGGITITPYVLSFTGSRSYDGSRNVNAADLVDVVSGTSTFNGVGTDRFTLSGSGLLSSANAGSYGGAASGVVGTPSGSTQIGVGGLALVSISGNTNNYTLTGGSDTYGINKAVINLAGVRQYDGTASVNGNGGIALVNGVPAACAAGNECWGVSTGNVYSGDLGNLTVTGNGSTLTSANVGTYSDNGGGFNSSLVLGGTAAGNYTLAATGNQFIIIPHVISLAGTRVYDAKTDADAGLFGNMNGTINGVHGEVLSLTGSGVVSNKNVNGVVPYSGTGVGGNPTNGQGFNLGTLALGNNTGAASNYTLLGGSDSLVITKATLTVTGSTVADKIYNGRANDAVLSGSTLVGLLSNGSGTLDNVTLNNGTTGTYASANAGTQNVSTSMSISGVDKDNYILVQPVGLAGLINKAALMVTANDAGKTYDGLAYAGGNGVAYQGFVNGETASVLGGSLVYGGSSQGAINAGNYGIAASGLSSGNYAISYVDGALAVGKAALTVTANDAGKTYDGQAYAGGNGVAYQGFVNGETASVLGGSLVYGGSSQGAINAGSYGIAASGLSSGNYTISYVDGALDVGKAALTVTANDAGKTYDGQAYAGGNGVSYQGFVNGETSNVLGGSLVYGGSSQGAINAGNYGIAASGLSSGNYTISYVDGALAVGKAILDLTGTRTYDATRDVDASLFGNNGVLATGVNGETVVLSGTGRLASKNVGNYTGADFGLGSLTLSDGSNGGLAGNYTLVGGTDTLAITPKAIAVAATAASKIYDGSTAATLISLASSGVIGNDAVDFAGTGAAFADPNAGAGKTVTVSGITAGGADALNYTVNATATTTADIAKAVLSLSGTRVYDGTANAAASDLTTIHGLVGNETIVLGGTGQVGDKNVGTSKALTDLNGLTLADGSNGGLAGNYTLAGGTDTLTITPAALTVVGTTVATKTYDGNTVASLDGSQLAGVLGQDAVTLGAAATGTFASPDAAVGIGVSTGMTIGGADAGNYVLVQPSGIAGTIVPVVLDLRGTRVYDATANANAALFGTNGVLAGINGESLVLKGTGQLASKDVGTYAGARFGLGTLTLADGGNGGLARNYTLAGGSDTLAVTPLAIVVDATGADKMYDATTIAEVTLGSDGARPGDQLGFGYGAAHFARPDVAHATTVTVTGLVLTGADAGNYVIANPGAVAYTAADITGARPSAFGIADGTLAQLGSVLGPVELATPYGVAQQDQVGPYTGNKKRLHRPVERNVSRSDFASGLALKVIDGGVRASVMALP